jgi:hypothetical protein
VKRISSGVTRTVYLVGKYAIKVPSGRGHCLGGARGVLAGIAYGLLANQSECEWYDYQGWHGGVAPVLHSWLGGFVNVYPRCQPLPSHITEDQLPELDPDPGDCKLDNFGLLDGRIVRLDYSM